MIKRELVLEKFSHCAEKWGDKGSRIMLSQIPETHCPELICVSLYSITCAMEKTLGGKEGCAASSLTRHSV